MGNKSAKADSKKFSKSDIVTGKPLSKAVENMTSNQMMDKFNAIIQKKKEKFYNSNLKPKHFTQMCEQVKVNSQ